MAGNTMTYSAEYLAEDRTALVTAFYALTIPLEILSTSYRLWVKASSHSEGHLSYDDYLILWATIVAVAESTAGLVYGPPKGLGRHVQALEPGSLSEYLKGDYILSHLYDFAIASTKLSILALYYRIFGKTRMRIPILITAGFVLAWLIEMEVVLGLGCQPIQGWWDTSENPTAKCVDKVAFTYSTNVLNLIFDFWIFAMPIPVILKLNVNKAKRIALCCLFSIGLGVCSISIVRLTFVFSAGSGDVTWEEVPFGILSSLEPCGAILCANLPIIYREAVRRFKSIGKSLRGASNANYGSKELPTPYRGSVGQDWIRIDNGGKKDEPGFPKTFIARGNMADSELDLTTHGGIKVEQERFNVDSS
ncbi:hypothetical protein NUW58_g1720 [Xylaria curta]|uniref:Uncharacterized protein n=2 Tax=Xylaria curta TaxID=42375 RepID=A0ACC1PK49_9PEZI|nr:hypothetical protein NUW58_g7567 [Xylaria curta]KAJ2993855.1 hypothetical protein NUW58_g1720 [Xylaria curta]